MDAFIKEIRIKPIPKGKYYSEIPSINSIDSLNLSSPITFLWAKMGVVNQLYLKVLRFL